MVHESGVESRRPTGGLARMLGQGALLALGLALVMIVVGPVRADAQQEGANPSGFDRVDLAVTPSGDGTWLLAANGHVLTVGDAPLHGRAEKDPDEPGHLTGIAAHPSGDGYWLVDTLGEVWAFGSATHHGDIDFPLNEPIVDIAATSTGGGYWLAASDGGLFAFGDAVFLGGMGGTELNQPIVAITAAREHDGYWLAASDGGVFTFGDQHFHGSTGGIELNQPITGMSSSETGEGYWLVGADGGVFSFGDAPFLGSIYDRDDPRRGDEPFVAVESAWGQQGYFLLSRGGDLLGFGEAVVGPQAPEQPDPVGEFRTDDRRSAGFPDLGATALLGDIRTGSHEGFERLVFEFSSSGDLEYRVGYVEEPPVAPSGEPVEVAGEAILDIHMTSASGREVTGPDPGRTYTGPDRFAPEGVPLVEELARVEDFEGHLRWVAGIDGHAPFAVAVLDDPQRLVIDLSTGAGETPGPLPGGELVRCTNPEGFSIAHPEAWTTNTGDVVSPCSQFDPDPFVVPHSDERVAAITAYIDPVPFTEVAAPRPDRQASRAATTIDGLQAVRLEYEAGDTGFWPAGTPITLYAVDLNPTGDGDPATLFLDTVGVGDFDHEQNQVVLDRMARTLTIERDDVPTDERVIARYSGATGFHVEGTTTDQQACLRIPPGGDQVCTDIPGPRELLTIQLTDLGPILAGVTGDQVFMVTAEHHDGTTSHVLPAPIADAGSRGFAFPFGLDDIARFTLSDITGREFATIEPGIGEGPVDLVYEFDGGSDGWSSDISDYSEATRPDDFLSQTGTSPPGIDAGDDFFHLAATNTSDDLFMYLRRQIGPDDGVIPGTTYDVSYNVHFASNAPSGCAGIGGPPGESVWLKVGASEMEPIPVERDGRIRLEVDKGNQSQEGPAAAIAGDVANGIPCEEALAGDEQPYAMVQRSATLTAPVTADADGRLWLFVGTDSGFEGRTSIFYDRIDVTLSPAGTQPIEG